jgi:transcriptional regulator with XRE-family HTH domain
VSVTELDELLRDAPLPLIAARIRRARREAKLTHDRLGALMGGVTRQHLIKLEQGRHRPRIEMLGRLADATERDLRWFVDPEVDPSPFPNPNGAGGDA